MHTAANGQTMTQRTLLIATRNAGKYREITAALQGLPLTCISLDDIPHLAPDFVVEEPAMTFEGNAIIKAMTYGHLSGYLTLADDAGLEVDALDGRPGVHSARYAPGTDADRYNALLKALHDVPKHARGAQFRAVIAIYDPNSSKIHTCEGVYRGILLREPQGQNGFGYDPIFYDPKAGKTAAAMRIEEKNAVSHRGQALQAARILLQQAFGIAPSCCG
jgi:XTP/dITP diphosphohydrolase